MTPEIIASETIERCCITTMVVLIEMGFQYVLLVTDDVAGWYPRVESQIKWTGSNKEEGLERYNDFVKEISE